jgi:CRP/FNR family nitrogen fixation transcriptional regulator
MSAALAIATPIAGPGFRSVAQPLAADRDPLGVEGFRVAFARNEEIFGEQEPAEFACRVVSGAVRTYKILSDGRRQVSEFHLPGDVFGIETGADHNLSAEAVSDTVVFAMRRRCLDRAAAADGEVARRLWALTLNDLRRSQDHLLLLGRKSARERVVWFLVDMVRRIPAAIELSLPVSRQDMADYLGLTIETVSRTMTQLQDQSLIRLRGGRLLMLRDRAALELIAAA